MAFITIHARPVVPAPGLSARRMAPGPDPAPWSCSPCSWACRSWRASIPPAPDADRIAHLALMRPGAATHAFNQDQHYVPLTFTHDPGTQQLVVRSPEHFNMAPVGWYMLFAVDQDSVPSLARWIHLARSVAGEPPPGPGPQNRLQVRAFPNPFAQTAAISFFLPRSGPVTIELFDAAGRRIRRLSDGVLEAGARELNWDGRNDQGQAAPDGVYFVKVRTPAGTRTEKLVLTR